MVQDSDVIVGVFLVEEDGCQFLSGARSALAPHAVRRVIWVTTVRATGSEMPG